jgi:cell fate regulator YaaT (PSP1 superfamily)
MFDAPEWTQSPSPAPAAKGANAKFAGVRFQRVGKVYHYIADGFDVKPGDWVVVDSARGRQMGQVASLKPPRDMHDLGVFKHIERMATGRDMAMRHYYENKELEAMIACRAESNALRLPIKIVKAEYSFDGQTLTFLYSSDQEERVETNELRQVMSRLYRARIETRQVSPREVAKIIGGMGACGIEQRCCSRFLTDFSPISIKHAKEQGLSLNPHDITGMCGRLRCCLIYEYEQYVEARRHLPKKNTIVGSPQGQGKVVDVLPLRDSVVVLIGEGEAAKQVVIHREEIVPLEELKRLQEKAASGACDRHENGGCDCGKGKAAEASPSAQAAAAHAGGEQAAPVEPGAAAGIAAGIAAGVVAGAAAGAVAGAEGGPKKKHKKKKHKPAGGPGAAQPPGEQGVAEQDSAAQGLAPQQPIVPQPDVPHAHRRFPPHGKHQPPARRMEFRGERTSRPQQDNAGRGASESPAGGSAGSGSGNQPRPLRRPLRRPLPHKPAPPPPPEN